MMTSQVQAIKPLFEAPQVTLYQGDCLKIMPMLEAQSFDAIICDLPYGTTACSWDSVIPFEPLWEQYKRLIKPGGAIVLFGSQPFTTDLIMSNRSWFKYEWIWEKDKPSNFGACKYNPLKYHENILVFSKKTHKYNPQMWDAGRRSNQGGFKTSSLVAFKTPVKSIPRLSNDRYPKTILKFDTPKANGEETLIHPTQKPILLLKYLAKTFTCQGDRILDNCFGSGSTGIACLETNRHFVGIEKDADYFKIGADRIRQKAEEINQMLLPPWIEETLHSEDLSADQIPIPL